MSLRNELKSLIRLQVAQTELGDAAVIAALSGETVEGSPQAIIDFLTSYCTGLENAVLRLADEVEDLRLGGGETQT
jgi:hypothetical protein